MCVYTHTYMFKHKDEDFQEKKNGYTSIPT